MTETMIHGNVQEAYPDYLRDESRRAGTAESISFPRREEEVRDILQALHRQGRPVTIQGARTGIAAGAVPGGGHVLNLSRMTRITGLRRDAGGAFLVTVQPGVILSDLRESIRAKTFDTAGWSDAALAALAEFRASGAWFFPPDPTETSAALGGMTASNASGACSFRYGPTRRYVQALRVLLADGAVLTLERGRARAEGPGFRVVTQDGRVLAGELPRYAMPGVKNAAGYFVQPGMDLVDLFIGAEGTLGVLTEIELRLVPEPPVQWGLTSFFPSEDAAIGFVEQVRGAVRCAAALEFFSSEALDLLRRQKAGNPAFAELPDLPPAWHTAVYVELHADGDAEAEAAVLDLAERLAGCGGGMEDTWLASDVREMQRLKNVRHAVPEAVNLQIDERRRREPGLTKLGTDLAVPDHALREVLALYHAGLEREQLEYVMFGHVGNNHLHVNILPRDLEEYERGKRLYLGWAREIVRMGGTVSAEHGIGKLKTALLAVMYGDDGIAQMRALKAVFDPQGRLNPGNLFEP